MRVQIRKQQHYAQEIGKQIIGCKPAKVQTRYFRLSLAKRGGFVPRMARTATEDPFFRTIKRFKIFFQGTPKVK